MSGVGWLGTGRMGSAMAGRLIAAGHDVTVWNRTRSKAEPLAEAGARVAGNVTDLAGTDVVFVMVATPADLEDVIARLLSGAAKPRIVVDCSTVDDGASARVRNVLAERGVGFLAAPVSGNPHVVASGESVLMVSGPEDTYLEARPLLESIGRAAVYVGPDEQARLVKICHNLYLGLVAQAVSEVTVLAEKAGVPRESFLEFLNTTVMGSDWVRKRTPDLLALDWTPTFTTTGLRKDFDIGLAAARREEVPMPLSADVMQLLQAAVGRGLGDQDFLSLFQMQADSSGMTPEPRSQRDRT